jgi:hypothetical protein
MPLRAAAILFIVLLSAAPHGGDALEGTVVRAVSVAFAPVRAVTTVLEAAAKNLEARYADTGGGA